MTVILSQEQSRTHDNRIPTLIKNRSRACLMSEEILHLLKGGFPDEGWTAENAMERNDMDRSERDVPRRGTAGGRDQRAQRRLGFRIFVIFVIFAVIPRVEVVAA